MNKNLIFLLILFLGLYAAPGLNAQQAKTDFTRVDQAYRSAKSLSMKTTYRLYATHEATSVFDVRDGFYRKQGKRQIANVSGVETLWMEDMTVVCDNNNKIMVVANAVKTPAKAFEVDIDSLLKICSKVSFTETDQQKKYRLEFDRSPLSEYTAVEVYIEKSSWMVSKLVLFYRRATALNASKPEQKTKPRLEIVYSEINTSPHFAADQFSENRYIVSQKGKISCAQAYLNYRFVNQKNP